MTTWISPPENLELLPDQVDVWRAPLALQPSLNPSAESSLSAEERTRAARFHFDADRQRFIAAHNSLRGILARYLHCEPREIVFSTGEYGKPSLTSSPELEFNLSHSGDYALIGVARGRRVGVDVERMREEMELERIASRFFSEREASDLMTLPADQQVAGFFNCWTRKEAYIKAHGLGLSLPLDSFDVPLAPHQPANLRATRPDPSEAARWSLLPLDVGHGYAGALVVEGMDLEFRYWNWAIP
jgi:4'-phosphopantetheinyl transferase